MERYPKGIIIGHKGEAIKKLGTLARKDIELFFWEKDFPSIICESQRLARQG